MEVGIKVLIFAECQAQCDAMPTPLPNPLTDSWMQSLT
jgi:hypothetical protein